MYLHAVLLKYDVRYKHFCRPLGVRNDSHLESLTVIWKSSWGQAFEVVDYRLPITWH